MQSPPDYLPNAACWHWDQALSVLHSVPDLVTAIAYLTISIYLLFIYRRGEVGSVSIAFPLLWKLAIAFFFSSGIALFGSALQVWQGGSLYYLTGFGKALRAALMLCLILALQRNRESIVTISRVIGMSMASIRRVDRIEVEIDDGDQVKGKDC